MARAAAWGLCCSFPPLAWFMLPIVAALPQMVISCLWGLGRPALSGQRN
jgi:hypothetical protein